MPNGSVQGPGYANPGGVPSGQPLPGMGARPRVRARRGQATDPHSIAERVITIINRCQCVWFIEGAMLKTLHLIE